MGRWKKEWGVILIFLVVNLVMNRQIVLEVMRNEKYAYRSNDNIASVYYAETIRNTNLYKQIILVLLLNPR